MAVLAASALSRSVPSWGRRWELDAARGLAIVAMMIDHVSAVSGGPWLVRWTVGRLAMPIFFVLAGYLCRRVSWRTGAVAALGVALPFAVPWIDRPNVLVWWAAGSAVLVGTRRLGIGPGWVAAFCLALMGNFVLLALGDGYPAAALVGLMALGALAGDRDAESGGRSYAWRWAERLPGWLAVVGERPVRWYVGHLLVLQFVLVVAGVA